MRKSRSIRSRTQLELHHRYRHPWTYIDINNYTITLWLSGIIICYWYHYRRLLHHNYYYVIIILLLLLLLSLLLLSLSISSLLLLLLADATVHDSLEYHNGSSFGTRDKVNEHCVHNISGGWWYVNNTECPVWSNLNGAHQHCGKENKTTARVWAKKKIHWGNLAVTARESAPMTSEMKIKPVDFP